MRNIEMGLNPDHTKNTPERDNYQQNKEKELTSPEKFLDEAGEMLVEAKRREEVILRNRQEEIEEKVKSLEMVDPKTVKDELKQRMNFVSKRLKKIKSTFLRSVSILMPIILSAFSQGHIEQRQFGNIETAKAELKQNGITSDQRQAYKPGISELLYKGVTPWGYYDYAEKFKDFVPNLLHGRVIESFHGREIESFGNPKEDAWRLYLGFPQKNDTFGISDYQPSKSKEKKYYYKINHFLSELRTIMAGIEFSDKEVIEYMMDRLGEGDDKDRSVIGDMFGHLMGEFTLSRGQDEQGSYFSYYDKWDLSPTFEGESGVLGKSFEIYDRIYFDPETHRILNQESPTENGEGNNE